MKSMDKTEKNREKAWTKEAYTLGELGKLSNSVTNGKRVELAMTELELRMVKRCVKCGRVPKNSTAQKCVSCGGPLATRYVSRSS